MECDWIVVSFAARLLGIKKSIHTAFIVYNIIFFVSFSFSYDLLLIDIAKAFLYYFGYFESVAHSRATLGKN